LGRPLWVRRLVGTSSIALTHIRSDPLRAACRSLRLLPSGLRLAMSKIFLAGPANRVATLTVIADWDRGDQAGAVARILASASPGATTSRLRWLTRLALAIDRPDIAEQIVDRLPETDPARPRLRALVASRQGRLLEANDALTGFDDDLPRREAAARQRLFLHVHGQLAALDPHSRRTSMTSPQRLVPVPRRSLHIVTNSLPHASAGYTVRTHLTALALRRVGLDPQVVTKLGFPLTQGIIAARDLHVVDGVMYHHLLPAGRFPRYADDRLDLNIRLAAELTERLHPAILHAASPHLNGQIALALRDRYGLPFVYEVRGLLEDSWLSRQGSESAMAADGYRLARELETFCMLHADEVVTLGAAMKAEIVARGVPSDRVHVIPNAVDETFLDSGSEPIPIRRAMNWRSSDVIVGLISTFYPHEGIDYLLRAIAILRERGHRVRLLLVGDGIERNALARLVEELDLGQITRFTGRVSHAEVRRYYATIDVFVVPRTNDRVCHIVTPLKPIEAMAAAIPVVASAVGGLTEIIQDGVTGILVPPEDPRALAEALQLLLCDEALRARLGTAAREAVAGHRTWSANAEKYRSLYLSLGAA
jgi:glycosyltransferase involved in cell wall biosynthesis